MTERDDSRAGVEVPELDLEPVVAKRPVASPPRRAPAPAPPAAPGTASRGRELDLEAGPGITLPARPNSARDASSFGAGFGENTFGDDDDDFELIRTGASMELAGGVPVHEQGRQAPSGGWPTGRSRPADQLPVDAMEVTLVAGFGNAPQNAVLAPFYAYRVLTRRSSLQRSVAQHHTALSHEESERDAALAQLAYELRATLEASDAFRRLLEPLREIERLAGDRTAALSQADAGFREQMGRFDQELGQLAAATAQVSALVADQRKAAELADNDLRRADAKHKRVQIEIRGVMDVARQALGPAGGDIPPAQAAQLAQLQARLTALEPELSSARAADASAKAALDQAQAELRRLETQSQKLERQKAAAGGSLSQQLSARAAGVTEAEQQRVQALAEVARGVLAARGSVAVPEATLQTLRAHDARVEARAVRLETHVRALDSYDHARVRLGIILTLSALGAVVLAIVLKAVL